MIIVPEQQSALVLRGGGSLGAYEAGAIITHYNKLIKRDKKVGMRP